MATSSAFSVVKGDGSSSYIKYRLVCDTLSQNKRNNTSTVRIKLQAYYDSSVGGSPTTNYAGTAGINVQNSSSSNLFSHSQSWSYGAHPIKKGSYENLYNSANDSPAYDVITHNADGTMTIKVGGRFYLTSGGETQYKSQGYSAYHYFNVKLTAIDRTPATVNNTISNIGVNGFTINATADVACDLWEYSIDGGNTWVEFATSTDGTLSETYSITGLAPNTTYNTIVRGRKQINWVKGESTPVDVKTIGNAVLNSVNTVTADDSTVTITYNATVYVPTYTHSFVVKDGETTVLTRTGLALTDGDNTITLTSSERTSLLTHMANMKSFTGSFELSTFDGATQIGTTSIKTAIVETTAANSAPTFIASNFTYVDTSAAASVVGSGGPFVQGVSTIRVTVTPATARNGSSISSYSLSFGNITGDGAPATPSIVISSSTPVNTSGTVTLTVSAIDSRGYTTSATKSITVLPYEAIKFTTSQIRRKDEVGETIELTFSGTITSLSVNSVEKNSVTSCRWRYKTTSDSEWGSWSSSVASSVSVDWRDGTLSYSSNDIAHLDPDYSWNVQVELQDELKVTTLNLVLSQGIPLMTFRNKKVGINVTEPTKALSVNGEVGITGNTTVGGLLTAATAEIGSSGNNNNLIVHGRVENDNDIHIVNANSTTVASLLRDSQNAGQFNIFDSSGNATVFCTGKNGTLGCTGFNIVMSRLSGSLKNRVLHYYDSTNDYGKSIWYDGNNVSRVTVEAGSSSNVSLKDANGNISVSLSGSDGKVTCNKMSIQDISSQYTISKSSGNWALKEVQAYRMGNMIQMNVVLNGNGSAVANGVNGFVGSITGGPKPLILTRFIAMASGSAIIGYYNPEDDSFQMRNAGSSVTISTTSNLTCGATFLVDD